MPDTFYEQFIQVTPNGKKKLLRLLTAIAPLYLLILLSYFLGAIGVTIGFVAAYLVYTYLLPKFKMVYEYSLVNKELSIAVIYNKASRKDLLDMNLSSATLIAPSDSQVLNSYSNTPLRSYTSQNADAKTYTIVITINNVLQRIEFEPNEKMIQHLQGQVPSKFSK